MTPRIEVVKERMLVGKHLTMTYAQNRTAELWRSFMPVRREITNAVGNDLFSMQVYDATFDFKSFNPNIQFEKWAAMEVADFNSVPVGMNTFILKEGLYAVFLHKGSSTDTSTFEYIFREWLPASEYELDSRPHFEVLGEKYRNNDPSSEEDIYIPIRAK